MPGFSYVAVDAAGKEVKGSMEADDKERVAEQLRKDGLLPMSIREQGIMNKNIDFSVGRKVKSRDFLCILPTVCQHHRGRCAYEGGTADAVGADRE